MSGKHPGGKPFYAVPQPFLACIRSETSDQFRMLADMLADDLPCNHPVLASALSIASETGVTCIIALCRKGFLRLEHRCRSRIFSVPQRCPILPVPGTGEKSPLRWSYVKREDMPEKSEQLGGFASMQIPTSFIANDFSSSNVFLGISPMSANPLKLFMGARHNLTKWRHRAYVLCLLAQQAFDVAG